MLTAKAVLALPAVEHAYDMVLRDLRSRTAAEPPGTAHTTLARALDTLVAVVELSLPELENAAIAAAGEREDELARERLDP